MKKLFALATIAAAAVAPAHAVVVTQWNFNSTTPDGAVGTGSTSPFIGAGTISLVGGTTSPSYNNGAGSSDVATDNSGWQTTTYAAQGAGDKTRGVQFLVSTAGFENITVSYDLRHSNTSSRYEQVQYSLDGSNWIDSTVFDGNAGDTWFNLRSVNLSSVAAAADNANFGVRVLSTFEPGTSAYKASSPTGTYAASGTWRFDMVTVSGTAVTPVPEPETYALLLAGLAAVGMMARRRA